MLAEVTLTPEQEALIPVYREKWRSLMLSTDPIDCKKAERAIDHAYAALNKEKPVIIYCSSPFAALSYLFELQFQTELSGNYVRLDKLYKFYIPPEVSRVFNQMFPIFFDRRGVLGIYQEELLEQLNLMHENLYLRRFARNLKKIPANQKDKLRGYIKAWKRLNYPMNYVSSHWSIWSGTVDFCASVLGLYDQRWREICQWEIVRSLIQECGWIFTFENHAIVCGRPVKISLDSQDRLHAEGTPAIQFADGYGIYYYRGVILPEKYGRLHQNEWQSQWLLKEKNAELRRVLIQGIGYSRICSELEPLVLDTWGEYSLLQFKRNIDGNRGGEPINLLKMTCPSTGHIHCLRVPPHLGSAREAIKWVNWEIDPEDFSVQT